VAYTDLPRLIERLARLIASANHDSGLKPAQWEALRFLSMANRFSRTPKALAQWLGSTKGTVSQTVISLEKRDLVTKATGEDRRSVTLELTFSARQILEKDPLKQLSDAVQSLPQDIAEKTSRGLADVLSTLIKAKGGRPFGVCRTCRHFSSLATHGQAEPGHFCMLLKAPLDETDAGQICIEQEAA
jgi:DNA-binding MarR family transcriptional regulator